MVLCQYRDITERSQRKLELEKKNRNSTKIQKAALIGNEYDAQTAYSVMQAIRASCVPEEVQHINMDNYLNLSFPKTGKALPAG